LYSPEVGSNTEAASFWEHITLEDKAPESFCKGRWCIYASSLFEIYFSSSI